MNTDYFKEIQDKLESYSHLGRDVTRTNAILIGKVPHIAPLAWLHCIYSVLDEADILQLESALGMNIPGVYRDFLIGCANGITLFSDSLNLYGLRKIAGRSIESVWQPYSLITPNTVERIKATPDNCFFFGGYGSDGSRLYIETTNNKVYRTSKKEFKPLNEWSSIGDMLGSETERLSQLFDKEGKKINPKMPTTP